MTIHFVWLPMSTVPSNFFGDVRVSLSRQGKEAKKVYVIYIIYIIYIIYSIIYNLPPRNHLIHLKDCRL